MQEAEVAFRHHVTAVHTDSAHFKRCPYRIAREQLVVARDSSKLHHAEFHHQMVNQFLSFNFGQSAFTQIAFDINVQEGRNAAHAHCRAVLRLNGGQVTEIEPLNRFTGVCGRLRNVVAIGQRHLLHFFERTKLIGQLFTLANHVIGHCATTAIEQIVFLSGNQEVNTV